jgi:ParB family chromosome partitioning protein
MDTCHVLRLHPHPGNVREDLGDLTELVASIRAHGILQPVVVQPHPQRPGNFIILAGHRRYEAAKKAGLDEVPITVRQAAGGARAIEIMLVENCQRRDLGPIEKAEAMGALRNHGLSAAEIGRRTGLSGSTVGYYLSLLELDEPSRQRIRNGQVSVGDGVEAVRLSRQRARKTTGRAKPGATWEPDHFTDSHPLARRAAQVCDTREHTMRRRIGRVACGQCWETVIRADERTATAVLEVAG